MKTINTNKNYKQHYKNLTGHSMDYDSWYYLPEVTNLLNYPNPYEPSLELSNAEHTFVKRDGYYDWIVSPFGVLDLIDLKFKGKSQRDDLFVSNVFKLETVSVDRLAMLKKLTHPSESDRVKLIRFYHKIREYWFLKYPEKVCQQKCKHYDTDTAILASDAGKVLDLEDTKTRDLFKWLKSKKYIHQVDKKVNGVSYNGYRLSNKNLERAHNYFEDSYKFGRGSLFRETFKCMVSPIGLLYAEKEIRAEKKLLDK